mmetsp:Transcript_3344/g.13591  ORF Transcript_3344/g.13591 Transcript_3344/m.13591 type:complete len:227 (+) Transcript_3344:1974-2654(+)
MLLLPARARVEPPDLCEVIAPAGDQALHRRGGGASGGDQGAGRRRGCPRHRGAADRVRALNFLCVPGPVGAVGDDGDATVGRRAREGQAELVRSPRDGVDGCVVEGRGGGVDGREHALLGLLPNYDLVIERTRRQERAELGVGPSAHPDRPVVPGQVREQRLLLAGDIEHLDGAVGRASRDPPAVVVVLTVMDLVGMTGFERRLGRHGHVSPLAPLCGPALGEVVG